MIYGSSLYFLALICHVVYHTVFLCVCVCVCILSEYVVPVCQNKYVFIEVSFSVDR
jgi:hypothetical protein